MSGLYTALGVAATDRFEESWTDSLCYIRYGEKYMSRLGCLQVPVDLFLIVARCTSYGRRSFDSVLVGGIHHATGYTRGVICDTDR